MTVSTTTSKVSYAGNGSTTTFNVNFYFLANSHLKVVLRAADGTETVKTLNTDYTVSGAGVSSGGSITFGTAPASGITVVIARNVPQTQLVDYQPNDPFPANTHEQALDQLTMEVQQLQEAINRSIKLSLTNTMNSTEFTIGASDRANKIFAFDGNGEFSITQELGTYRGNWSSGVAYAARDIIKDTSNNNIYFCTTSHTSSGAQPISTNTDAAKWSLLVDAASATSSASAAATSASAAATSATSASGSASAASTSASSASTSATNASSSASSASSSASSASSSASSASTSATNAASSATAAANSAASVGFTASSTTTFQNKTLDNTNTIAVKDTNFTIVDDGDTTKKIAFQASGITTGNTRTVTMPDSNLTMAGTDLAQSFSKAQRGSVVALTDAATITPDAAAGNNFSVTLGGNRTLANPTNLTAGQAGIIVITQDGTGSRTLAYGIYWKFPAGTAPTLTTTASAVDVLAYYVESASRITARLIGDVK